MYLCIRPCFYHVQRVKNGTPLLVFYKCDQVIIWIPKYFLVSEQQFSLSSDPEMMWVLLSDHLKWPGPAPSADIAYEHQPVNKPSPKCALEGWGIGQTLMLPSEWWKVRDLRTHIVWGKPNYPQGEAGDRGALETNSAFETNRKFRFPLWEVQCTLL